jgi:hypothetical protein
MAPFPGVGRVPEGRFQKTIRSVLGSFYPVTSFREPASQDFQEYIGTAQYVTANTDALGIPQNTTGRSRPQARTPRRYNRFSEWADGRSMRNVAHQFIIFVNYLSRYQRLTISRPSGFPANSLAGYRYEQPAALPLPRRPAGLL